MILEKIVRVVRVVFVLFDGANINIFYEATNSRIIFFEFVYHRIIGGKGKGEKVGGRH